MNRPDTLYSRHWTQGWEALTKSLALELSRDFGFYGFADEQNGFV